MSLSQDPGFSLLKEDFVVGWKNIRREKYVGSSHGYTCENEAVGTTNGAGPRNMQMYVLAPDGTVLHCLPGFWHPEDLAHELQFAKQIFRLHKDKRSRKSKRAMYQRLHASAIRNQPASMLARSGWQGFDAKNERDRLKYIKKGERDTFYYKNGKPAGLKPTSVIMHERMAKRPFVAFSKFDVEVFVDYGRPYYDNNGGGVRLGNKGEMETAKRMAAKQKIRDAKKAKSDKYYGKKPKGSKKAYAKKGSKKKSKKRPTSRPTSRPMMRKKS